MEYKVFWCKTNKYFTDKWAESELLRGKSGVFVSSCVVTDKAKSKWVRFVRQKLKTLGPDEKIYISGCGSMKDGEIDRDFYEIYPELVSYKNQIELLPEEPKQTSLIETVSLVHFKDRIQKVKSLRASERHTKKFVVVQMGCDNFCTFCLTVQARGRHRSRSTEEIIREIAEFADSGWQEVVLTGTNIGAWGAKSSNDYHASKFVELVHRILAETSIPRLRISSLGVEFMDEETIGLFTLSRVNPYVHLSIQSGSDHVLRAMNRHYDRATLLSVLERIRSIRREDDVLVNIGADIIVGFPGETESDFHDTLDLIERYGITQLHAFPFSPHRDHYSVPAGSFPDQIADREKDRRLKTLMETGESAKCDFIARNVGKDLRVLIERLDGMDFQGWSENYIECTQENFWVIDDMKMERGGVYEGYFENIDKRPY